MWASVAGEGRKGTSPLWRITFPALFHLILEQADHFPEAQRHEMIEVKTGQARI